MTDRRLICNLWHIKQTNGLYYYALDYVRAIGAPNVRLKGRLRLFSSS